MTSNRARFVVATHGTEGDARPLAALCRALMDAGHEARLLADQSTLGTARTLNVPVTALAGDIRGTLQPGRSIAGVVANGGGFSSTARALATIANDNAETWMKQIVAAATGCDAIIVSALASFVGLSAAEYLGVRAIGASLIPLTPSREFASPFLPPRRIPRCLNRANHRFVNGMLWAAFRKATNAARVNVCALAPRRAAWTDHPMLYGISPSLVPQPSDWPDNARMCGQWIPPSPDWSPPSELSGFLAAGEAPIYIGFGSMMGFDQSRMLQALIAAVAGRRTLFNPGWSGIDTTGLPANFFVVGDAPHDWLFPRTSVVIHHGGSGTTHSALRAGVPSVVVPFAGDQFFWADRLRRIGVASGAVSGKALNAAQLVRSIEFARNDATRGRAREIGARMMKEDGLATAVTAIEAIMAV